MPAATRRLDPARRDEMVPGEGKLCSACSFQAWSRALVHCLGPTKASALPRWLKYVDRELPCGTAARHQIEPRLLAYGAPVPPTMRMTCRLDLPNACSASWLSCTPGIGRPWAVPSSSREARSLRRPCNATRRSTGEIGTELARRRRKNAGAPLKYRGPAPQHVALLRIFLRQALPRFSLTKLFLTTFSASSPP